MIKGYVYCDMTFILNFANYLRGSLLLVWFSYLILGPLILVLVAIAAFLHRHRRSRSLAHLPIPR